MRGNGLYSRLDHVDCKPYRPRKLTISLTFYQASVVLKSDPTAE